MSSLAQYEQETRQAVIDAAQAFHLEAVTNDGLQLAVPCTYQILEPGFRPFKAAKASPEELQSELDDAVAQAKVRNIDPGIEGHESVRKMCLQLGLGIDCSNLGFRTEKLIHERVGAGSYAGQVFRPAQEISDLNATKESWTAKDENGHPRPLTPEERTKLDAQDPVSTEWVASVFGKDPEFIVGSHHMTSPEAALKIEAKKAQPGDLLAFRKAGTGVVSHVAVVENVDEHSDIMHIDFWHSWHTRDFEAGLRRDYVQLGGRDLVWSHEGLGDATRYQEHYLCRPVGLVAVVDALTK